jgi:hypothetical protein
LLPPPTSKRKGPREQAPRLAVALKEAEAAVVVDAVDAVEEVRDLH